MDGVTYVLNSSTAAVIGYTRDVPAVLTIPASVEVDGSSYAVTEIGENAFLGCANLTEVVLSEGIGSISRRAFSGCGNLTKVSIPATVSFIGMDAFYNCTVLAEFSVASGNPYFSSKDGVLFEGTTLLAYPIGHTRTSYTAPSGTTEVAQDAFYNCQNLTSLSFPDSLEVVEGSAFEACSNLANLQLGAGLQSLTLYALENCHVLTKLTLPRYVSVLSGGSIFLSALESITITGSTADDEWYTVDGVLYHNDPYKGLTLARYPAAKDADTFAIPEGVVIVGESAFWDAAKLTQITFPSTLTIIENTAFTGCSGIAELVLPANVKKLDSYAFQTCRFTSATLLGVETMDTGAFSNCSKLKTVNLPASLREIGDGCFRGCSALEAINVEEGGSAFASVDGALFTGDYTKLLIYPGASTSTEFEVPAAVTSLDASAFSAAKNLQRFTVEAGSTAYKAVDGVLFSADGSVLVAYPLGKTGESYVVPTSVTEIGDYAFYYHPSITAVTLPDGLEVIGKWGFGYTMLTAIELPEALTTIYNQAFMSTKLKTVRIPAAVTAVDSQAFDYCHSLDYVEFTGTVPPSMWDVFSNSEALRYVYVPVGTQPDYLTALTDSLPVNAMVVEGEKVPLDAVLDGIAALDDATPEEVNELSKNFVRLTDEEKESVSDENIIALDDAYLAANPGLTAEVDDADCGTAVEAAGLAVSCCEYPGSEILLDVNEEENANALLDLSFTLTVDGAEQQPRNPVLVTVEGTPEMAETNVKLVHVDGKTQEPVDFTRDGNKFSFRADSFSDYVFIDVGSCSAEFGAADSVTISSFKTGTVSYIAARYLNGQLVDVVCGSVVLSGDAKTVTLPWSGAEADRCALFLLDGSNEPDGEAARFTY